VRAYNRHSYSPHVHRLTRRQLNHGANAVADVAGANQGCGQANPQPGRRRRRRGELLPGLSRLFCIPPPPPDVDCDDVNGQNFTVRSPDLHAFASYGDGVGCET
jgi:hypothetical protein